MNKSEIEMKQMALSAAVMLLRMKKGQFKAVDLWGPYGGDSPQYRQADRMIQRERKAGRIRQVKRGVWEKVEGVQ